MIALETNPWVVTAWTVVIIALSAFFVAAEFALMAAKQHRLERRADTWTASWRLEHAGTTPPLAI